MTYAARNHGIAIRRDFDHSLGHRGAGGFVPDPFRKRYDLPPMPVP